MNASDASTGRNSDCTVHQQFILEVMILPTVVVIALDSFVVPILLVAAFFVVTFAIRSVGRMVAVLSFGVRIAIFPPVKKN